VNLSWSLGFRKPLDHQDVGIVNHRSNLGSVDRAIENDGVPVALIHMVSWQDSRVDLAQNFSLGRITLEVQA